MTFDIGIHWAPYSQTAGIIADIDRGPAASLLYGNGRKEIQAVNASLFGGFVVVNYVNE